MEFVYTYLFNTAMAVVSNFKSLNIEQQLIYVAYLISAFVGPYQTYKQVKTHNQSNEGIGSTDVDSLKKQAGWSVPAFLYSFLCAPVLVVPLFFRVGLDLIARCLVIRAAIRARDRAAATKNTEAANDENFEGELDAA